MRAKTLKWIVLCASVLIALIIIIQLFWLNRVYSYEQKSFNVNVVKSIRGLYEDVELQFDPVLNLQNLIEHPQSDYFLFRTETLPPPDTLTYYLKQELEDFDVLTDAYLSVYKPSRNEYSASYYISTVASIYTQDPKTKLIPFKRDYSYLALYFPHRNKYILYQMIFWFVSSGALIIVLIVLAISLFYFYRQKFLSEVQKEFLNNFTHEFKTPLAVMKIASGVLMEEDILLKPMRLKNYAGIIQNQTDHLQQQVEKLLRTAASEENKMPINKEPSSINNVITQAVKKIQPLADVTKAILEIKPAENDWQVSMDGLQIELALINLLENALKYAPKPHIIIETGRDKYESFISVKDNGIGIEKKYISKIFKKFFRVPTGNLHDVKGFGLGLDFVKKVADSHKGKVIVKSIPGIGTEFKMILPNN